MNSSNDCNFSTQIYQKKKKKIRNILFVTTKFTKSISKWLQIPHGTGDRMKLCMRVMWELLLI